MKLQYRSCLLNLLFEFSILVTFQIRLWQSGFFLKSILCTFIIFKKEKKKIENSPKKIENSQKKLKIPKKNKNSKLKTRNKNLSQMRSFAFLNDYIGVDFWYFFFIILIIHIIRLLRFAPTDVQFQERKRLVLSVYVPKWQY